jgi:hypothetical protein
LAEANMTDSNEKSGPEPVDKDRRASARYPCALVNFSTEVSTGVKAESEHWAATIVDISVEGVALLLRRPFEPGTVLTLALRDERFKVEQALQVRVAHLKPRSRSEWLVGCSVERPLTEAELRALL